jgi:hypothetical protein
VTSHDICVIEQCSVAALHIMKNPSHLPKTLKKFKQIYVPYFQCSDYFSVLHMQCYSRVNDFAKDDRRNYEYEDEITKCDRCILLNDTIVATGV